MNGREGGRERGRKEKDYRRNGEIGKRKKGRKEKKKRGRGRKRLRETGRGMTKENGIEKRVSRGRRESEGSNSLGNESKRRKMDLRTPSILLEE